MSTRELGSFELKGRIPELTLEGIPEIGSLIRARNAAINFQLVGFHLDDNKYYLFPIFYQKSNFVRNLLF